MQIIETAKMEATPVESPEVKDIKIKWVIDDKTGAPNFAMRIFDIAPGGFTPLHRHDWEHEIYIISGEATAVGEGEEMRPVKAGDAVFVAGGELHQFKNTSAELMKMMCLIPLSGKYA